MKFIDGQDRNQMMIPDSYDQHISENNPIRFIDAFVENLKIDTLGFKIKRNNPQGRAAYHPFILLKLYIYGYLNKIRSSRDLERETYRNIELFWLLNCLHPDHSSIARFRKNNRKAIRNVCREFILVCKKLDMFGKELIAIDGSFFKGSASKEKLVNREELAERLKAVDQQIEKYLSELNNADQIEDRHQLSEAALRDKIEDLKKEKDLYQQVKKQLEATGEKSKSLTDPDARLLKKNGKSVVGYNVQTAVDSKHNLIVEHEVTTAGNDSNELAKMALKTKQSLGIDAIEAVADSDYYNSQDIKTCVENQITPYVPARVQKRGEFSRDKFSYAPDKDCYICPLGSELRYCGQGVQYGRTMRRYRATDCKRCTRQSECTKIKSGKVISRWEHETILEDMQINIKAHPNVIKKRKSMVEHPFGILKRAMGMDHFLTRGMENVKTEISLHVLVYNLKRVLNIESMDRLMGTVA